MSTTDPGWGNPDVARAAQVIREAKAYNDKLKSAVLGRGGDQLVSQAGPERRKLTREVVGWSRVDVANATGLTPQQVESYETRDAAGTAIDPTSVLASAYRKWVMDADAAINQTPELQARWLELQKAGQ